MSEQGSPNDKLLGRNWAGLSQRAVFVIVVVVVLIVGVLSLYVFGTVATQ